MKMKMICLAAVLAAIPAWALLNGVSPVLSGEMLKVLNDMGHGEEIVISDANFPAHATGRPVIRADGVKAAELLKGLRPLFELDSYAQPVLMMAPTAGDTLDPRVERDYRAALGYTNAIERLPRAAFYDRAKQAAAVIVSGETAKYGNVILRKGVIQIP